MSQETHAGRWLGFRQPVAARRAREARRDDRRDARSRIPAKSGRRPSSGSRSRWKIDPDGSLGIRKFFESPYRPGEKITVDEYYGWMFENSVPGPARGGGEGRPDAARSTCASTASSRFGRGRYSKAHEQPLTWTNRRRGVVVDGVRARRLQHAVAQARVLFADAGRLGLARARDSALRARATCTGATSKREDEFDLLPNFRLPTLDPHALAGEVALRDLAQQSAVDRDRRRAASSASRPAISSRCTTGIGYFVTRAWVTEGIRPGVVGMSHHLGPLAAERGQGGARNATALVKIARDDGRPLRDAAGARRAAVREQRSRQRARLVERGRRAPEPDVPGAARSGQRHALLASARDGSRRPARTIATATSSSTPRSRTRSTRSGWRRRAPRRAPTARAGRCGSIVARPTPDAYRLAWSGSRSVRL